MLRSDHSYWHLHSLPWNSGGWILQNRLCIFCIAVCSHRHVDLCSDDCGRADLIAALDCFALMLPCNTRYSNENHSNDLVLGIGLHCMLHSPPSRRACFSAAHNVLRKMHETHCFGRTTMQHDSRKRAYDSRSAHLTNGKRAAACPSFDSLNLLAAGVINDHKFALDIIERGSMREKYSLRRHSGRNPARIKQALLLRFSGAGAV